MPADHFAGDVAARYDAGLGAMSESAVLDRTIDVLAELAGDGAALEFAIGTGRVALPLRQRGVPVAGIDFSPDMVAQLRAKPGADGIAVTIGNIATTRVEGSFALVYLVFNTIMNLTTQDEQVACFANAAAYLQPGGCFVVEVGVPALRRLPPGQTVVPFHVQPDYVGFDEYTDLTEVQRMTSHHYRVADGRGRVASVPFRYVWPAELDLMARLAGMTLCHRWATWSRDEFTSDSPSHVSVWARP